MLEAKDQPSPWPPERSVLTRVVTPETMSLVKISAHPFVSPETRLLALLENATYRPSSLRLGVCSSH
jgi:hypothetical protein